MSIPKAKIKKWERMVEQRNKDNQIYIVPVGSGIKTEDYPELSITVMEEGLMKKYNIRTVYPPGWQGK